MKIGIDARMYGAAQTGIGIYIKHLIEEIVKLDRENEYRIFLLEPEYSNFFSDNAKVKTIKVSAGWYGWKEQIILPRQFLKEQVDLMHFPHFNAPLFYPRPCVVTIHDLTPKYFPGHKVGASRHRRLAFEFVLKNILKKAETIIAVSEYTKQDILRHYPVSPDKMTVIYEGARLKDKVCVNEGQIQNLKNKYGIKKPFIFYVGVWRNHKNLTGLIRAFGILIKEYKLDIELVLGGKEDPFYPEARQEWERSELGSRIIRPGFIPDEELPLFYKAAEVFAIPSFAEGFGLVGLEAMNFGAPVASSSVGSLPEILGRAAVYFNPADHREMAKAIFSVLSDTLLRKRLIETGFEQAKKYSWRKMAEETLKVYKEAVNE